jgi:serine/threonine protein kinase
VIAKIASGGMAELFLARQLDLAGIRKKVVLKHILPNFADNEEFIQMFLDEARVSHQLNHPNIVQIYEVGQISGIYYIAMEYIHGQNLKVFRDRLFQHPQLREPPPYRIIAAIIAQTAAGLYYAHTAVDDLGQPLNVIHRDISPNNILVSYTGNVKIVDFGVAKASTQQLHTQTGNLKGRLGYMSPEQILELGVTPRSDIFALGVVLYELTTYRRLFKRRFDAGTIHAILNDPIHLPSTLRADYPPMLEQIVMRALQRNPEARYETAEHMRQDIERYLYQEQDICGPAQIAHAMELLFEEEKFSDQTNMSFSQQSLQLLAHRTNCPNPEQAAALFGLPIQQTPVDTPAFDTPSGTGASISSARGPIAYANTPPVVAHTPPPASQSSSAGIHPSSQPMPSMPPTSAYAPSTQSQGQHALWQYPTAPASHLTASPNPFQSPEQAYISGSSHPPHPKPHPQQDLAQSDLLFDPLQDSTSPSLRPNQTPYNAKFGQISEYAGTTERHWSWLLGILGLLVGFGTIMVWWQRASDTTPKTHTSTTDTTDTSATKIMAEIERLLQIKQVDQAAKLLRKFESSDSAGNYEAWVKSIRAKLDKSTKLQLAYKFYRSDDLQAARSILLALQKNYPNSQAIAKLFGDIERRTAATDAITPDNDSQSTSPRYTEPKRETTRRKTRKISPKPKKKSQISLVDPTAPTPTYKRVDPTIPEPKPPVPRPIVDKTAADPDKSVAAPDKPKPPLTRNGILFLHTTPTGRAELNGRMIGYTPINGQRIPVGKYKLTITQQGYIPLVRSIEIREGKPVEFDLTLQRIEQQAAASPRKAARPFSDVRLANTVKLRIYARDPRGIQGTIYSDQHPELCRQIETELRRILGQDFHSQINGITKKWQIQVRSYAVTSGEQIMTFYPKAIAHLIYHQLLRGRKKDRIAQLLVLYQSRNRFKSYKYN